MSVLHWLHPGRMPHTDLWIFPEVRQYNHIERISDHILISVTANSANCLDPSHSIFWLISPPCLQQIVYDAIRVHHHFPQYCNNGCRKHPWQRIDHPEDALCLVPKVARVQEHCKEHAYDQMRDNTNDYKTACSYGNQKRWICQYLRKFSKPTKVGFLLIITLSRMNI